MREPGVCDGFLSLKRAGNPNNGVDMDRAEQNWMGDPMSPENDDHPFGNPMDFGND